ncbi:hypothetical protein [Janibacter terrae]|uniref:hypothetical protein n=1 Tax=Janibacter terrae TaxID=103817 RepID=UPI00082B29CE|nr:hypothetical protein [Janibacter terrae]MBA4085212.1 hypothetical protein [Kytococcus sp.]
MSRRTTLVAALVAAPLTLGGCGLGASIAGIHDAPAEQSSGASVTSTTARQVADRVVTEAVDVSRKSGKAAETAREEVLSGPALREVRAAVASKDRTTRTSTQVEGLKVLAVSRGATWPRAVLATSRSGDVQYLHVLVAEQADQPFTLFADVPMAAGASVPALAPLDEGTKVTVAAPGKDVRDAATAWAKGVAFPSSSTKTPEDVSVSDAFSAALRKNARATKADLGDLAYYRQRQAVAEGDAVSFALADGGAITFLPMTRTDTITATKKLKELKLEQAALKDVLDTSTVERALSIKHAETLALVTPAEGKARVVGASDVLESAKGS